jgi:hypothetical protein
MSKILTFILLFWIVRKFIRIIFPVSKKSYKSPLENKPRKSRTNMDIQDAEFEDME